MTADPHSAPEANAVDRKRLVADRFHRIWQIVECIAREPGKSRLELADRFSLSERQVQADLNVIRSEMRLPLVRRQGYRFVNQEGGPIGVLELQEAQLLLLLLRQAQVDRSVPAEHLTRLIGKLPSLFPPHLQPLIGKMVQGGTSHRRQQEFFQTLTRAMLKGSSVRLHYPRGSAPAVVEPEVKPELLLPYCDSWYLIGTCKQRNRLMMFDLDSVDGVNEGF
jgi:predicted DNA-binding transcriptional regulator YafY